MFFIAEEPRQPDRQLIPKMSKMYDNFIIRMLYKDKY